MPKTLDEVVMSTNGMTCERWREIRKELESAVGEYFDGDIVDEIERALFPNLLSSLLTRLGSDIETVHHSSCVEPSDHRTKAYAAARMRVLHAAPAIADALMGMMDDDATGAPAKDAVAIARTLEAALREIYL